MISDGLSLPSVSKMRHISAFNLNSQLFKCAIVHAKMGFFWASNAILGETGHFASEEATLDLFHLKCMPLLPLELVGFPVTKSLMKSLDFTVDRLFLNEGP